MLSVSLLWALLLYGQQALAFNIAFPPEKEAPAPVQAAAFSSTAADSLGQEEQKISREALALQLTFTLHQAVVPLRLPTFAAPTDEEIPSFMAKWHRGGFLARLFPIIIQPNAP